MPRKVFVAGEILTAADVNTNLMDQAVMVFDDATDRATAIPTPVEGMVTYLKDEDEVTVFDGSVFKAVGPGQILQVVSTIKTDPFTVTNTAFQPVTALSATITPSSTSSKILVFADVMLARTAGINNAFMRVVRGATAIGVGDAEGVRASAAGMAMNEGADGATKVTSVVLDSPSTVSSITYTVEVSGRNSGAVFVNRTPNDDNNAARIRGASSITLLEVAG